MGDASFANGRPAEPPRGVFQNGEPWCALTPKDAASAASPERHRGCTVCHHDERVRIEALHVAGVSLDKLANQFSVHRDAIHRHCKNHLTERARAGYLLGPAKVADLANAAADESRSLIDYYGIIRSLLMNQLDRAAQLNKGYEVERIAGRVIEVLKEIGHITGEVCKLASTTVNITNNNVAILNSAPFMDLQAGLLQICGRHPEARSDIVALFKQLDEKHAAPESRMIEGKAMADA